MPGADNPVPCAEAGKVDDSVPTEELGRGLLAADPQHLPVANRANAVDAIDHAPSLRQMRFQPSHIRPPTPPERRSRMIAHAPRGWHCCAPMPTIPRAKAP